MADCFTRQDRNIKLAPFYTKESEGRKRNNAASKYYMEERTEGKKDRQG